MRTVNEVRKLQQEMPVGNADRKSPTGNGARKWQQEMELGNANRK